MKKILSLITVTFLLSGCAESLALLGTTTSGASSGKITQSAISSAMSYGIKRETGKSPSQHALAYVQKHNPQSKKKKCIDFIEYPNLDLSITDRLSFFRIFVLITLRSLKRNVGLGFPVPKGSSLLMSV